MATASFLTFATLLVLMTLSWSQPGMAAPISDDGNPERLSYQKPVIGSCDSTWTAGNHKTSNPKTCKVYADRKYCAGETYGPGWKQKWGTFEDYADSEGKTALVCPECGWYGMCPACQDQLADCYAAADAWGCDGIKLTCPRACGRCTGNFYLTQVGGSHLVVN